ncbi:hypothetical protein HGG71_02690 [Rhodobacteraceae bacterium R_SAG2]|nr:hypothetical protein [Rhodobacteraceae bacterium R_SAG2]
MAETITEAASVGRPPKKDEDKYGGPRQVTMKPAGWVAVDEYLAAHDLQWMEFVRAAIREKLARDKNDG